MKNGNGHSFLLQNRTILVVNTGTIKKKFTFQKLKKLGLNVVVLHKEKNWATPYVDHWILADTNNYKESVEAVKIFVKNNAEIKIDGVLTYWEDNVLLVSKIIDTFNFIGIPYAVAKHARNKFLFREFCEKNNIQTPKHILIQKKEDLKKIKDTLQFPLVIKPIYGASSAFVVKIENETELVDTYEYIKNNILNHSESAEWEDLEILVEEYIDGDEVDIDILIQNGKIKFSAISDNFQTIEPFFLETGQAIPSTLPEQSQKDLLAMAEETLEKLGIQHGCIHFEAKSTKKGPVPIEVNLRMGGDYVYSYIKGAWNIDLIEYSVRIALGDYFKIPKQTPKKYIIGKDFLTENSGIVVRSEVDERIRKKKYIEELHFYKQIGDPVFAPPEGYESLGWVTVSGDNSLDAQANLAEVMKHITYEVVKYDPDSYLGKTRRRNRFSSAVLNKDLLLREAKIVHFNRLAKENQRDLHIGVAGNTFEENSMQVWERTLIKMSRKIEKTLRDIGYRVSFFDFRNIPRAYNELAKSDVDLVFNACMTMNGRTQLEPQAASLLELLQTPYTGSNPFTLALSKDKISVKKMLEYHDIPTPKWDYVDEIDDEIDSTLQYPLIVKPSNMENSLGITNASVVTNKKDLKEQLEKILHGFGSPVLIEEYIDGDEYDVSILGNDEEDFRVLPLTRSIFKNVPNGYWHIYPYDAKLSQGPIYDSIIVQQPPKNISKKLHSLITEIALDTYSILGCYDYGRVGIKVDKNNNPYVLELNANPELTDDSLFPTVARLIDFKYPHLISEIIRIAIKRYQKRPASYYGVIPSEFSQIKKNGEKKT